MKDKDSKLLWEAYLNESEWTPLDGKWELDEGGIKASGTVRSLMNLTKDIEEVEYPVQPLRPLAKDLNNPADDHYIRSGDTWVPFPKATPEEQQAAREEDEERTDAADFEYPIIVAMDGEAPIAVVDGNHRVLKAAKLGMSTINAKLISKEQLKS